MAVVVGTGVGGGAERAASSWSSSSVLVVMQRQVPAVLWFEGAPNSVHRQWLDIPVMLQTCTHSTNCADDRRDSPGAAFGPVLDMPVVVHQVHSRCVKVVGNTVVAQRLSPLVLTGQKTIAMLVSRQSSSHSCNRRIRAWTRSLTCPLLCNDRCPWFSVQKNCEGPAVAVLF